jgi:hypothetical protein
MMLVICGWLIGEGLSINGWDHWIGKHAIEPLLNGLPKVSRQHALPRPCMRGFWSGCLPT